MDVDPGRCIHRNAVGSLHLDRCNGLADSCRVSLTIVCNHCGERVIAKAGEHCPSCRLVIGGGAPDAAADRPAEPAQPAAKAGGMRGWLARRMRTLAIVGVVLCLYALLGGVFRGRGAGYAAEGRELVWIGLALFLLGTVMHLILRVRRKGP